MDNELKDALTTVIKAEISPVLERLDKIEVRLDKIEIRLDKIEVRLDNLELEQSQIKQAVLETNEIVKRLENVQDQQHRIIELLSARSIEQEAKLKKII